MSFENLPTGIATNDPSAEVRSIEETCQAVVTRVGKLQTLVSEKRDALRAQRAPDLARAGVVETDGERRVIDKERQRSETEFIERGIAQEVSAFRRTLTASSHEERSAMLNALLEKLARLDALETTFPSPTSFLASHGLGSQTHANLVTSLLGEGKASLMAKANLAVIRGDKILAAALVAVNDRLPRHDRGFASPELAGAMVGKEHAALLGSIKEARRQVQAAIDLDNLFVTGDESPMTKISRGVAARTAARRATA